MLDHAKLRSAIARRLGQVLTPDVAAELELAAREILDESHNPEKFGTKEYKGLVFRDESLGDVLEELHPLHERHFQETEKHRLGFGLHMDYDYLTACERRGGLIQFTCRDFHTGRLVGNIRVFIGKSLHTGTLYATEDTFYVLPEYRLGFAALRFWQFMEDCVQSIGVREIRTDSKVVNNVHRLNDYLGYQHVANKYIKVFQE
jgi:hypothetical protein